MIVNMVVTLATQLNMIKVEEEVKHSPSNDGFDPVVYPELEKSCRIIDDVNKMDVIVIAQKFRNAYKKLDVYKRWNNSNHIKRSDMFIALARYSFLREHTMNLEIDEMCIKEMSEHYKWNLSLQNDIHWRVFFHNGQYKFDYHIMRYLTLRYEPTKINHLIMELA